MTREDLKGLKYSIEWVKSQINRYEEQQEMVYGLSQKLDGLPKAQNKPSYAIENLIDKYNELLEILANEQQKINDTIKQMNNLEPIYRTILSKKYIEGKKLEEIATDIHYNYYDTCKFHGEALNEFDKLHKKTQDFPNKNVVL